MIELVNCDWLVDLIIIWGICGFFFGLFVIWFLVVKGVFFWFCCSWEVFFIVVLLNICKIIDFKWIIEESFKFYVIKYEDECVWLVLDFLGVLFLVGNMSLVMMVLV